MCQVPGEKYPSEHSILYSGNLVSAKVTLKNRELSQTELVNNISSSLNLRASFKTSRLGLDQTGKLKRESENVKRETRKLKRESENEKRETGNGKRETRNWNFEP